MKSARPWISWWPRVSNCGARTNRGAIAPRFFYARRLCRSSASRGRLAVDGGNTVVQHNAEPGDRFDDRVPVKRGVEAGDRVIVRGLQQVRPGMPVQVRALPDPAARV